MKRKYCKSCLKNLNFADQFKDECYQTNFENFFPYWALKCQNFNPDGSCWIILSTMLEDYCMLFILYVKQLFWNGSSSFQVILMKSGADSFRTRIESGTRMVSGYREFLVKLRQSIPQTLGLNARIKMVGLVNFFFGLKNRSWNLYPTQLWLGFEGWYSKWIIEKIGAPIRDRENEIRST